MLSLLN